MASARKWFVTGGLEFQNLVYSGIEQAGINRSCAKITYMCIGKWYKNYLAIAKKNDDSNININFY